MRADNVLKGSRTEGYFYAECLKRGKNVCIPLMPMQFDCVVVGKFDLKRVQIKSSYTIDKSSRGEKIKCMLVTGRKGNRGYTKDDTEIIVFYSHCYSAWYIFPISVVENKLTISLFPTVKGSKSKYEQYKERWDLL